MFWVSVHKWLHYGQKQCYVCSRIRSPGNSSQGFVGDTGTWPCWIRWPEADYLQTMRAAALPICFFFLFIMTNSLLLCTLIILHPSYHCLTPILDDNLFQPTLLLSGTQSFILLRVVVHLFNSLSQGLLSYSFTSLDSSFSLNNFVLLFIDFCILSFPPSPVSSLRLANFSILTEQVSDTGYSFAGFGTNFQVVTLNFKPDSHCLLLHYLPLSPNTTLNKKGSIILLSILLPWIFPGHLILCCFTLFYFYTLYFSLYLSSMSVLFLHILICHIFLF